jgi:hypothetical protein
MKHTLATCVFTLLLCDVEQSGERPVSASRRPMMVVWPGSGHLHLHLAWAQLVMAPSPGGAPGDGREWWTLGRGSSEAEVFLATDQVSDPHG